MKARLCPRREMPAVWHMARKDPRRFGAVPPGGLPRQACGVAAGKPVAGEKDSARGGDHTGANAEIGDGERGRAEARLA